MTNKTRDWITRANQFNYGEYTRKIHANTNNKGYEVRGGKGRGLARVWHHQIKVYTVLKVTQQYM